MIMRQDLHYSNLEVKLAKEQEDYEFKLELKQREIEDIRVQN